MVKVNVVNYISRPTSKDFIQVEIVVEKESQKIILIGKVCCKFVDVTGANFFHCTSIYTWIELDLNSY